MGKLESKSNKSKFPKLWDSRMERKGNSFIEKHAIEEVFNKEFKIFFKKEILSDVKLNFGLSNFEVHKTVLIGSSAFFYSLFSSLCEENASKNEEVKRIVLDIETAEVEIEEFESKNSGFKNYELSLPENEGLEESLFKTFLLYLYTGEIPYFDMELQELDALCQLSKKYGVPSLQKYIEQINKPNKKNCQMPFQFSKLKAFAKGDTSIFFNFKVKGEKYLKASPILLAAHSEYFASMFSRKWKESFNSEITLPTVPWDIFEIIARYCSTGTLRVPDNFDVCLDVLYWASYFSIDSMLPLCGEIIQKEFVEKSSSVGFEEFVEYWNILTDIPGTDFLREPCKKFLMENFERVSLSPSFFNLRKENLLSVLENGALRCSFNNTLERIMAWVKHNSKVKNMSENELIDGLLPPKTLFCQQLKRTLLGQGLQSLGLGALMRPQ